MKLRASLWYFLSAIALLETKAVEASHGLTRSELHAGNLRGVRQQILAHDVDVDSSWTYEDGGASWSGLGQCSSVSQSPINISAASPVQGDGDDLYYSYQAAEAPVTLTNDGHVLSATFEGTTDTGTIYLGKSYPSQITDSWKLYSMLVHTPSEHTFEGQIVPLELQLVHHKADNDAAENTVVVSIGFVESIHESRFLNAMSAGGVPLEPGLETIGNQAYPLILDFGELYRPFQSGNANKQTFWQYTGSLTQPPCTVGVRWLLRQDPLPATHGVLEKFQKVGVALSTPNQVAVGNARLLQNSNGRSFAMRKAIDASTMMQYESPGQQTFENLVAEVKHEQHKIADAVEDSGKGKTVEEMIGLHGKEYLKMHGDKLAGENLEYQDCLKELNRVSKDLHAAKSRRQTECAGQEDAQNQMAESGAGITRLEAAERLNGQTSLCNSEASVVTALAAQVTTQQKQCGKLKDKAMQVVKQAAIHGEEPTPPPDNEDSVVVNEGSTALTPEVIVNEANHEVQEVQESDVAQNVEQAAEEAQDLDHEDPTERINEVESEGRGFAEQVDGSSADIIGDIVGPEGQQA